MRSLPLFLALTACASGSQLDDVDVTAATIRDIKLFHFGALVAVTAGEAVLDVTTTEGDTLEVPVSLSGPSAGLLGELSYGIGLVELPLISEDTLLGEAPIPGTHLLGVYEGEEVGLTTVIGVHYAALTNEHDVWMPIVLLDFGGAAGAGYSWITVEELPEE